MMLKERANGEHESKHVYCIKHQVKKNHLALSVHHRLRILPADPSLGARKLRLEKFYEIRGFASVKSAYVERHRRFSSS